MGHGQPPPSEHVPDALEIAVTQRRPRNVIHHSDQGAQGGFKWSSQQLGGQLRWQVGGVRIGLFGISYGRRVGLG